MSTEKERWDARYVNHREFVAGGGSCQYWAEHVSGKPHLDELKVLGLKPRHRLLDFGCGSLRIGRWLVPYLDPENYYGIEPNLWLVVMALAEELPPNAYVEKRPTFSDEEHFDTGVFAPVMFDYVLASAVFIHAGCEHIATAIRSLPRTLAPEGVLLGEIRLPGQPGTFWNDGRREPTCADHWRYPNITPHEESCVKQPAEEVGLRYDRVEQEHLSPGTWFTLRWRC